ncbi:TetR/AcrR family transcriptional regulator [Nocardioides acrostichi]|uniref:TetR/AcrR family transcriptional regulator n=1 Tax=Nocardioides acrostichi TaxID=2784339 RepID=A0A930UVJ0_9ACTN|nr:TetR/AcrR family transcriptional regulator [Nocardioides acrostichi]MBF4161628.1 TetR/AcrR family transcriptional regulator [Nocardioides acrostichi]
MSTRERILAAAEACLRRDGIRRTTVQGVADEAGLSRAYLYRFFPDKAGLVSAVLIHRDQAFWDDAGHRISSAADEAGVAGMVAEAVLIARGSALPPLGLHLFETEPVEYARVMGRFATEVVPGLAGYWEDWLADGVRRGLIRPGLDLAATAEWVLRQVISLVVLPGTAVDVDDRESLRRYLGPFLEPALGTRALRG